jgi:hypothetical protein
MNSSDLKVDAIAVPSRNSYMVIYNINIPVAIFREPDLLRDALERSKRLLIADLAPASIFYQLTASYVLRNTSDGLERLWTGSFHAQGNRPAQLSGFERFDRATFVQDCIQSLFHVEEKLTWFGQDTSVVFDRLLSIIINVNTRVGTTHPVLEERNLLVYNARYTKKHRTFALP